MRIADHVWYVTGGASGLGEATVRRLHQLGGYVSIWDISFHQAKSLASDLNKKGGAKRVMAAQVDVISQEQVLEAIRKSDETWPDVQVGGAINCGGVEVTGTIINAKGKAFDLDTFRRVIEINVSPTKGSQDAAFCSL